MSGIGLLPSHGGHYQLDRKPTPGKFLYRARSVGPNRLQLLDAPWAAFSGCPKSVMRIANCVVEPTLGVTGRGIFKAFCIGIGELRNKATRWPVPTPPGAAQMMSGAVGELSCELRILSCFFVLRTTRVYMQESQVARSRTEYV